MLTSQAAASGARSRNRQGAVAHRGRGNFPLHMIKTRLAKSHGLVEELPAAKWVTGAWRVVSAPRQEGQRRGDVRVGDVRPDFPVPTNPIPNTTWAATQAGLASSEKSCQWRRRARHPRDQGIRAKARHPLASLPVGADDSAEANAISTVVPKSIHNMPVSSPHPTATPRYQVAIEK